MMIMMEREFFIEMKYFLKFFYDVAIYSKKKDQKSISVDFSFTFENKEKMLDMNPERGKGCVIEW